MKTENQLPTALVVIKKEIDAMASVISAPGDCLPTYQISRDLGYPHLEWDNRGYHWVVIERGRELERITTSDSDELLYIVFQNATFNMSTDFEVKNRNVGKDCRRMIWEHQLQLLDKLKPEWVIKRSAEIEKTLTKHPFDDMSSLRAQLTAELRRQGFDDKTAWDKALTQYPLEVKS